MKEEIKEIFNKYGKEKYNDEYCLKFETYVIDLQELKKIYDYITNLQESEAYYYGQYKDYKQRNEKAIEYIKECKELEFSDLDLLNILKGDKDE